MEVYPQLCSMVWGFWERLIGLTKLTLKNTLGRTHAIIESLQKTIVEIEALLNDLPLTQVSPDLRDPEPINPAHLLYGKGITTLPHCSTELENLDDPDFRDASELQKWARLQTMVVKNFWTR